MDPLSRKELIYVIMLSIGWAMAIIFAGLFGAQMDYRIKYPECSLEDTGITDYWPFPVYFKPQQT